MGETKHAKVMPKELQESADIYQNNQSFVAKLIKSVHLSRKDNYDSAENLHIFQICI